MLPEIEAVRKRIVANLKVIDMISRADAGPGFPDPEGRSEQESQEVRQHTFQAVFPELRGRQKTSFRAQVRLLD